MAGLPHNALYGYIINPENNTISEVRIPGNCAAVSNSTTTTSTSTSTTTTAKTTSTSTTTKSITSTASTTIKPNTTTKNTTAISACQWYQLGSRAFGCYYYDEQVSEAFGTSQNQKFTNMSWSVIATAQNGTDGIGPAYFLNGYTNQNYWYQVGLSYNWTYTSLLGTPGHNTGFSFISQVWNGNNQVYPSCFLFIFCGSSVVPLNIKKGDIVRLSLNFSHGHVIMSLHDLSEPSINYTYSYTAYGNNFEGGEAEILQGLLLKSTITRRGLDIYQKNK